MASHNFTITQESVNRSFTITQDGDSRLFTINTGVGPAGTSATVDQTIIDGSTNAVSGNAVFDGLALKAPIANPTFTGIVTAPRISGRCDGMEVLCKAGLAINAGQVVYVTGASGNNIIIGLAQANAEVTSSKTIGISESTLANNATGYVITEGLLTVSISAPTAVEGDPIWLSPTTAGGMVFGAANKPVAPNHMVYLGVVTRKTGNTVVEIFVKVQNGSELDELADVLITSPTAGQALMRGASLWSNRSLVSADISDATANATPNTIVKRGTQGGAAFAGTNGIAISATSTTATAVSAVSTNSTAVYGESGSSDGGFFGSIFGTGLSTYTDAGDYHAKFGGSSGDNRSFVARVSGAFGWWRGAFRGFLQAPASITSSDKTWTLPNNTGTVALTTDAMTPTAHASSHVTGGTDKIRDASAAQDGLMTTTFAAKLNGIEAGADVTDATNVNAAGAVMESDYSPSHSILVQQSGTGSPSSLSIGNNTLVGRLSGGGSAIDDLSASQVRTLLNVEDGADVTDAANVASTITGATSKTTPVDADEIPIADSAASFGLKKVTFANVFAYIQTKLEAAASIVFTGQLRSTNQTAATADALMTRGLVDDDDIDFDKYVLRDEFISFTVSATSGISQLSWNRFTSNGAGAMRSNTVAGSVGVCGLICQAAFRAGQMLTFSGNTATGAIGFLSDFFDNATTVIKGRVHLSSLNTRFDFGLAPNLLNGGAYIAPYSQSRKFGINYTKQPTAWTALNVVTLNEFRRPTVSNGRRYYASVGGITGATEPTWPTTNGDTVVDGTVTWTESGREGGSTFVIMQHTTAGETAGVIVDTGITVAINTYYNIKIEYVTSSQWRVTINGVATLINTSAFGSGLHNPQFVIENTDNGANILSIDYFGMKSRITR